MKSLSFRAIVVALLIALTPAPSRSNCVGSTLWAYDSAGGRIITISTDGFATVTVESTLHPSVGQLEGIAWSEDGNVLYALMQNGAVREVNLATGTLVLGTGIEQMFLTPETGGGLTFNGSLTRTNWVSGVVDPNTPPLPTFSLRTIGPLDLPTDFASTLITSLPYRIAGLDAIDCNYTAYFGLVADDFGLIRVVGWEDFGGWGTTYMDALAFSGESVEAAAYLGTQVYTVGNTTGTLARFRPMSTTFGTVTPQTLGTLPSGTYIRGLSFGPAPSGGSTTTTTTSSTSTTTTLTSTTTMLPPVQESAAQIRCIAEINKRSAKVAGAMAKSIAGCGKDRIGGKIPGPAYPDVEACVNADPKGKVAKAQSKTTQGEQKACQGAAVPDYGYTSAASANTTASGDTILMFVDAFGLPFEAAFSYGAIDPAGGSCQRTVMKEMPKLLKAKLAGFNKCKKTSLASGRILRPNELGLCLGDLHNGQTKEGAKILKAQAKMTAAIDKSCALVATGSALPGACAAQPPAAVATCLEERVECRACLMLTTVDGFTYDCDVFDDGFANHSCVL